MSALIDYEIIAVNYPRDKNQPESVAYRQLSTNETTQQYVTELHCDSAVLEKFSQENKALIEYLATQKKSP